MKKLLFILTIAGLVCSCSQAPRLATYQKQEIECLGVEGDGSQTIRVTGTGRNKADAVEQAKKDAVNAVIFKGIRGGLQGCDSRPLINELDARDKYADYFDIFFMDKGEYSRYASMEDRKLRSNDIQVNKSFCNFRITVRVLRSELRARLREDGILK
jgi:hypothetical protein